MGGVKKTHRTKKYNYDKNRRRTWAASKKMPIVRCQQMKVAWNERKSVAQNMIEMGLSANPNKTFPIPNTKELMGGGNPANKQSTTAKVTNVIKEMEKESNAPLRKCFKFSKPEQQFCIYMMEKYNEDYKAMAKDSKNYYQETPKQIKRKINKFKSIPEQYDAYLKSKQIELESR